MPALGWLGRITHLGVDLSRARSDTKHIVLTNQYTLFILVIVMISFAGAEANALLPDVRTALLAGVLLFPVSLVLNAIRRPALASAWLLLSFLAIMTYIGTREPLATEHVGFLILNATVAWFLFAPERRPVALGVAVASGLAALALPAWVAANPPPEPRPGFDVAGIALGNQAVLLVTLVFFSARAAYETARVERELVEERRKREALLEGELAHQVAERSRELGAALSRPDAPRTGRASRFGDRYEVLRPLGEGGMGAVFEVERKTDGRRLALKVIAGQVSREHAARFAREAEIGARVRDPHLVSIVDVGMAEGSPFLVMELVTGGTLESRRERFGDPTWAVPVLRDVAAGLAALHDAGIVHRDLKPANVLLDASGRAKVADFGIARVGFAGASVDPSAATAAAGGLTGTGAWVGTPLYMAPESSRGGRESAPPADVFAFGLLAYELITRERPFATPAVLLALADQPLPPPADLRSGLVEDRARSVIPRCLARDPADRPTIREIRTALG